jgi:hypothetical protein
MTFPLQGACVMKSGRVCAHSPLLLRSYRLKSGRPEIVRVLDGRQDIEEIFSDDKDG